MSRLVRVPLGRIMQRQLAPCTCSHRRRLASTSAAEQQDKLIRAARQVLASGQEGDVGKGKRRQLDELQAAIEDVENGSEVRVMLP